MQLIQISAELRLQAANAVPDAGEISLEADKAGLIVGELPAVESPVDHCEVVNHRLLAINRRIWPGDSHVFTRRGKRRLNRPLGYARLNQHKAEKDDGHDL